MNAMEVESVITNLKSKSDVDLENVTNVLVWLYGEYCSLSKSKDLPKHDAEKRYAALLDHQKSRAIGLLRLLTSDEETFLRLSAKIESISGLQSVDEFLDTLKLSARPLFSDSTKQETRITASSSKNHLNFKSGVNYAFQSR